MEQSTDPIKFLITGATGWIGASLIAELGQRRCFALDARRRIDAQLAPSVDRARCCLIHLAGLAHRQSAQASASDYERVNRDLTVDVAEQARVAGIGRLIFVSTARVMGRASVKPWTEADAPDPPDAYSRAKLEAERAVLPLAKPGQFDVIVVRPPLVYGPGVHANFRRLLIAVDSGWPLPVSSRAGQRSMVFLENLIDALRFLSLARQAAGVYFVRDGQDSTTIELIADLRRMLGRPPRMMKLPPTLLRSASGLAGRGGEFDQLFLPAQVDDRALRELGWQAPVPALRGLELTVQAYRSGGVAR